MNPVDNLDDRTAVSRAFRFSALNQVINRILTFGSGALVFRLLSVRDVGTFAGATAVVIFCTAFNDFSMSPAVIHWSGNLKKATQNAWTLAVSFSLALYAIVFFSAPALAHLFDDSDLTGVLRLLALAIIIDGFGSVPLAMLTREMKQKRVLLIETLSMFVQISLTIGLALAHFGAYALAWGMITSNAVTAGAMFLCIAGNRTPGYHRETNRALLKYGIPLTLSNIMREITTYFDNIIVGAIKGPAQLGFYQMGYNGGNLPENTIGNTISRVAFAWFSQLQHDVKRRTQAFHDLTLALLAATLPFVTFLAVLSHEFIRIVYGEKWLPAANIVTILTILGGIRVFINFFADIFSANGHPLLELKTYTVWGIILLPCLFIGAHLDGIQGVAFAHIIVVVCVIAPMVLINLSKHGFSFHGVLKHALPILIGVILQALVCELAIHTIHNVYLAVIAAGIGGLAVYFAATYRLLHTIKRSFGKKDFTEPVDETTIGIV